MPKNTDALNDIRLVVAPKELESTWRDKGKKFTAFAAGCYIDGKLFAGEDLANNLPARGVDGTTSADGLDAIDGEAFWLALRMDWGLWPLTCSCGIPECAGFHEPVQSRRERDTVVWTFPKEDYFTYLLKHGLASGEPRDIVLRFDARQLYSEVARVIEAIRAYEDDAGVASSFSNDCLDPPDYTILQQLERAYDWRMAQILPRRFARHKGKPQGACVGALSREEKAALSVCAHCGARNAFDYYETPLTDEYAGQEVTAVSRLLACRRCKTQYLPPDGKGWHQHARLEYTRLHGPLQPKKTFVVKG